MSIVNDLNNHVDVLRHPLRTMSLRTPDRILSALLTRTRFKTGVAGAGYSLTYLRNSPSVVFYRGMDTYEATDTDPRTTQIIASWSNVMAPVNFAGTELEETLGLRSQRLTRVDYGLGQMSDESRLVFLNYISTGFKATAAGLMTALTMAWHGRSEKIASGMFEDRMPMSRKQLFDDSTGLYGQSRDALGEFESGHPWARTGEDTEATAAGGATRFGRSLPYKMVPRRWDFSNGDGRSTALGTRFASLVSGRATLGGGTPAENDVAFHQLYGVLSEYNMVVPGTKLAVMSNQAFQSIAHRFIDSQKYPLLMGTDKWQYSVTCFKIEDVYVMADPNKLEDEASIEVYHIGDVGAENGTIFPFMWNPDVTVRESIERENDYMLMDVPAGMDFGAQRDIPFYMDDFAAFEGNADAIGTHQRLKYMMICTEPWCQLVIDNVVA